MLTPRLRFVALVPNVRAICGSAVVMIVLSSCAMNIDPATT